MLQRYPYDPTGRSLDNLVRTERHVVTIDGNNVFFPRYGAYFNDSLVVKQGEKALVLNQDYQLSFFWQDATIQVGKPISLAFNFINDKIIGEIQIDYQVVGGEWAGSVEAIEQLKQNPPDKHRNVFWDEVIGKPEAWQPTRHIHHVNDVYGLTPLVLAVEEMKRSLENQSVLKLKSVYDRFLKLKQYVEANIANADDVGQALKNYAAQMEEKLKSISDRNEVERLIAEAKSQTLRKIDEKYDPRVQALETNKEEVARTLTTLANEGRDLLAKINANKANIATNRRDIDALKQKQQSDIDTLTTKVNQNNEDQHNAIQRLDTKTTTELARVADQLASATNTLNDKLTEKETALTASINEKVGALTNRINEVSTGAQNELNRLIENEKSERVAAITAMNDGLTQYKNTQAQIDRAQNERIDGAEAKNREQDTRLDELDKKVTNNKEAQDAKNTELSERIDGLVESTKTVDASKVTGLEDAIAAKIVQNNDGEVNRRIQNAIAQAHQEEADQRVAAKEEVTTNVLAEVERNYLRKTMKNGAPVNQRIDNPLEIGAALTFRQDGEEGSLSLVKKDIEIPAENPPSSATGENPTGEHPEGTAPNGEGTQPTPAPLPPTIRHVTGLKINAPGGNLLVSDGKIWNTNKDPDSYLPTKHEVDQLLSNQKTDLHLENYVTKHQDEEISSNKTFLKDKKLTLNDTFLQGTEEGLNLNDKYHLVEDKIYKGNDRDTNYLITKKESDGALGSLKTEITNATDNKLNALHDTISGETDGKITALKAEKDKELAATQAAIEAAKQASTDAIAAQAQKDVAARDTLSNAIDSKINDAKNALNARIDTTNTGLSVANEKIKAVEDKNTQQDNALAAYKKEQAARQEALEGKINDLKTASSGNLDQAVKDVTAKIDEKINGAIATTINPAINTAKDDAINSANQNTIAAVNGLKTNLTSDITSNYFRKTKNGETSVPQTVDNPTTFTDTVNFKQGEKTSSIANTADGLQVTDNSNKTILFKDGKVYTGDKGKNDYLPTKADVDKAIQANNTSLNMDQYVTKDTDQTINSHKTFNKDKKLILNASFLKGTDEGLNINDQYYLVGNMLYKGNGRQDNYLITKAEVDRIRHEISGDISQLNVDINSRINGNEGSISRLETRLDNVEGKNTEQDQALSIYKTEQEKKLTALEGKITAASNGAAGSLDTAIEKVKEDTVAKINAAINDRINPAIATAKTEAIDAASTQAQQAINGFKTTQDADNATKYFRKSKNGDQAVPQTIENPTTFKDTVSFNSGNNTASISTGNNGLTLTGNDNKSVVIKDGRVYTGDKGNNDYLLTKADVDNIVSSNNTSLNLNQYLTKDQDETITSNKTFSKDKKLILNASFMKGTDEGINLNDQYYLVGDKLYKGNDRLDNYLITKAEVQPLLTALQNTVNNDIKTKLAELESELAKKPNHADVDPEVLKRQVKKELDSHIAEARANATDDDQEAAQRLPEYIVHPDAPNTNVTGNPDGGFRVEGIVYMNPNESHQEYYRAVFTPTTELEWTSNNTWVIPDIYDGLVAQVFVTSGIRIEGGNKIKSPSTKMRYVKLVGGQSVPITVGSISSFGSWLTNDGVDTKNVIYPSMVIPSIPGITYQPGQHAKVLVIV